MPTPQFILDLRRSVGHASLWLPGVSGVISRDDGYLLLVRRADNGRWSNVGGIIEPGEEPADALEREILEEAGVVALAERLAWTHVLAPHTYPNGDVTQYLELTFGCRWVSGDPHPADGENIEVDWFSPDRLPDLGDTDRRRIRHVLAGGPGAAFRRTT